MANPTASDLIRIIDRHDRFKGAYFWTPPSNASGRRSMEKRESESFEFDFLGDHYEIDQAVSCSCKNVYYSLIVRRNGAKKDVRALRSLLKDMLHAAVAS